MNNFDSRLRKLDDQLPRPVPDPWEGRSPEVRTALARVALAAASAVGDRPGRPGSSPDPEAVAAGLKAESDLAFRLDFDDLGHGPLDEAGKARVREIADEEARRYRP